MIKRLVLLLFMGGILIVMPSYGLAAGMEMDSVAEKEVTKVDKDGNEYLAYVSVDEIEVVPDDIVRFTNAYRNEGKEAADAGLTITNPVPKEMAYIGASAAGTNATITFSVDGGKSYDKTSGLFVIGEDGKRRLALPGEYTHIKWVLLNKVLPGEEGGVAYKAKVK